MNNLPVGLVAVARGMADLPNSTLCRRRFDFFGFANLSVGIAALQMMLDRGAKLYWFASSEICLYTALAASRFWIFVIHITGADKPFLKLGVFAGRNFRRGLILTFIAGIILLAARALLPPVLSKIFGYLTITAGLVMGPGGVCTMIAMLPVGKLVRTVGTWLLVVVGLLLPAASLDLMTDFSPQMGSAPAISTGVIQCLGLGLSLGLDFVPLSMIVFSTIDARYRADATSLFSLVRIIGSSIGISIVLVMLARNIQTNTLWNLGAALSPYNPVVQQMMPVAGSPKSLALHDLLVNQQAAMIFDINDFKLMMIASWLLSGSP